MSLFHKDCPQCAARNSVDAIRCSCGYCFEVLARGGEETAAEEEKLYREYLAARAVQATKALDAARAGAVADPQNRIKVAEMLRAQQNSAAARAELASLTAANRAAPSAPPRPAATQSTARSLTRRDIPPAAPARPANPAARAPAAKPTSAFQSAQTTKAAKVVRATPAGARQCPHCTASVSADVARCHCGYAFPADECLIPALDLSAADRAALAQALTPSRKR
ncbi:MAG: hypothetical protein A2V92_00910 [Candidatus Muproteobacteria bacterium RBG_16_65_31]|uniref:Uncharacterized protein n=1 Tax=Candidatus Muproteobacteria bacterium RBG_16_65_31 TaxID=1817759 RepID=A0A1F6TEK9_9PROT|nr:MAG: hypothetical protein A2V92_00910 [Candidatus Muproteobacteria bacterium RBG_16_65_31]